MHQTYVKRDAIEMDIREYHDQVEPLAKKYPVSMSSSESAYFAAAADSLIRRIGAATGDQHPPP